MARKESLSPLREWEQEEQHSKIGLLTLYRMQTEVSTCHPNPRMSRMPKTENKVEAFSHRNQQKKVAAQPIVNIFSHRSVFDKRKKFQSNSKKKKFVNHGIRVEDKKTLLMKQYSFGEMNQEEIRQSWLRSKIYREFVVSDSVSRKTHQRVGTDVVGKIMNTRSNQKKQKRALYSNRFKTEASDMMAEKERYQCMQEGITQNNTNNQSQISNHFLQAEFCSRRKKYFNYKNTNNFRDYCRKNKPKGLKHIDLQNYSSNLLTSSLQNMPCQAINEAHGAMPRTHRLKDTIKQYLKSIERRSFPKKMAILQSI